MTSRSLRSRALLLAAAGALLMGGKCSPVSEAPTVPMISGPSAGVVGAPVTFRATATDPDDDSIAFQCDWGDVSSLAWTNFIASGETTSVQHAYSDSGTFSIKAKAKDKKGKESGWSAGLALRLLSAGPAYPDSVCDSIYLGTGGTCCCMSQDGSLVAVGTNTSNDSVSILRVSDRTLLPRIRVDLAVAEMVFSDNNQYAYANSWNSHALYRVDVANRRVVDTLEEPVNAHGLLLTPDGSRLLLGTGQYVFVVRADSLAVLDSVLLPYNARCMVLNRSGTALYVGVLHGLCAFGKEIGLGPGCDGTISDQNLVAFTGLTWRQPGRGKGGAWNDPGFCTAVGVSNGRRFGNRFHPDIDRGTK